MPVDDAALYDAMQELRRLVANHIEVVARDLVRNYLLANPAQTPVQVLNALFPDPAAVTPDDVIRAMVNGVRREDVAVGVQRRLTWIGP